MKIESKFSVKDCQKCAVKSSKESIGINKATGYCGEHGCSGHDCKCKGDKK